MFLSVAVALNQGQFGLSHLSTTGIYRHLVGRDTLQGAGQPSHPQKENDLVPCVGRTAAENPWCTGMAPGLRVEPQGSKLKLQKRKEEVSGVKSSKKRETRQTRTPARGLSEDEDKVRLSLR